MSASLGLYRLQQVDSRLTRTQTRLAVIRETLSNDAELHEALARVEAAEEGQRESERNLRKSEGETQSQQIKIQQTESSLYSGAVHNPKELQDLQNEVAALKRHLATLEERQLEDMLKVEAAQAALQRAQADLQEIQSRRGEQHSQLLKEQAALSRDLERLEAERQATVSAIAADMLALYEDLRTERRGVAVAEIADGGCAACGTTLTPAQQQNVRQMNQLVYCPTCGRILYAG